MHLLRLAKRGASLPVKLSPAQASALLGNPTPAQTPGAIRVDAQRLRNAISVGRSSAPQSEASYDDDDDYYTGGLHGWAEIKFKYSSFHAKGTVGIGIVCSVMLLVKSV